MAEVYNIPGFETPDAPNTRNRIEASSDGQVVFNIETLRVGAAVPAYKVVIFQDFGGRKVMFLEDDNQIGLFSEIDSSGNYKHVYFYLSPASLVLAPGSYAIEASINGTIAAFKWLAVPARLHENAMSNFLS